MDEGTILATQCCDTPNDITTALYIVPLSLEEDACTGSSVALDENCNQTTSDHVVASALQFTAQVTIRGIYYEPKSRQDTASLFPSLDNHKVKYCRVIEVCL